VVPVQMRSDAASTNAAVVPVRDEVADKNP